ncbi:MAG: TRAP transporter large permease [Spirochaetaceae bacterium]|nr:TRAP transporter large permease [Spirochaetaceae bacterium]
MAFTDLAIILAMFFGLMLLGVPVYLMMLATSLLAMVLFFPSMDLYVSLSRMVGSIDSITLMAIPFFIFTAELVSTGNMGKKLVNVCLKTVGHLPGGFGIAVVASCTVFGAISGSGTSGIIAIGTLLYPALIANGYPKGFSLALICSSSTLAMLIPPSVVQIVFALNANASIAAVFMANMIVGLLLAFLIAIYVFFYSVKKNIPRQEKSSLKEILQAAKESIWALGFPILLLGSIYGGVATPTEAASLAVGYILMVEFFVSRTMKLKDLWKAAYQTGRKVAIIYMLIATGALFGWILTMMQIPQTMASLAAGMSYFAVILTINLLFFVFGMFIEPTALIIVMTPIVYPIALVAGINPVHLGILVNINAALGMLTPPFGMNVFVGMTQFKVSYMEITRPLIPQMFIFIFLLLLFSLFPEIGLWFPRLFGFVQ